mmetsp:Transcript_29259/g.78119  ORF Transcript_29259/g.78119 Transcript_29259/m.78119 type:complete len:298 (+) Transcript_29259:69-962(+)
MPTAWRGSDPRTPARVEKRRSEHHACRAMAARQQRQPELPCNKRGTAFRPMLAPTMTLYIAVRGTERMSRTTRFCGCAAAPVSAPHRTDLVSSGPPPHRPSRRPASGASRRARAHPVAAEDRSGRGRDAARNDTASGAPRGRSVRRRRPRPRGRRGRGGARPRRQQPPRAAARPWAAMVWSASVSLAAVAWAAAGANLGGQCARGAWAGGRPPTTRLGRRRCPPGAIRPHTRRARHRRLLEVPAARRAAAARSRRGRRPRPNQTSETNELKRCPLRFRAPSRCPWSRLRAKTQSSRA